RWRLYGDADQRLARLPRPGAAVPAFGRRQAFVRRRPDQGSAAALGALPDPRRGPRGGAPAFDSFGGALDAARDRPARRAAADDTLLFDEMRPHRARALLPARRSGRCRRDQGTGRQILIRAARQSRPGGFRRYAGRGHIRDRGTGRDREIVSAAARAQSAVSHAGTGGGFDKSVWADTAGAWARLSPF